MLLFSDDDWWVWFEFVGVFWVFVDIGLYLCDFIEFVIGEWICMLSVCICWVFFECLGCVVDMEDIVVVFVEMELGVLGILFIL